MVQVAPNPWEQQHPPTPRHRVDGWRGEGWGQPNPRAGLAALSRLLPSTASCSQVDALGQDQALEHSSAAVVPDPCSAPPRDQGEMAQRGCPCRALVSGEHPGTPSPRMGLVGWRRQPAPGHLQDLQPPQGTESSILNAADLVLVQLPAGERQREHCWDSPGRERPVAPDASCHWT